MVAYYLPALGWILIQLWLLLPIWLMTPPPVTVATMSPMLSNISTTLTATLAVSVTNTPTITTFVTPTATALPTLLITPTIFLPSVTITPSLTESTFLDSVIFILLLALGVAILLMVLNGVFIYTWEGRWHWLKAGLLKNWTDKNRRLSETIQKELADLHQKSQENQLSLAKLNLAPAVRANLEAEQRWLENEMNKQHEKLEQVQLPHDLNRVAPTRLGNIYGMAEDYAFQRYRLDAVLFWPRLYGLMADKAPEQVARLNQQKSQLDLCLNLTLLLLLLAAEFLLTSLTGYYSLALAGVVCVGVSGLCYYAMLGALQGLGELIKISFDQYRHFIAESFQLKIPADLPQEQELWLGLTKFIRWGEARYFPSAFRQ
jgi:hypothetical protein